MILSSIRIKTFSIIPVLLLFFLAISCDGNKERKKNQNSKEVKEALVKANRKLVKTEDERIEDYTRRHNWQMTETGTGLRYLIYKNGDGEKAKKDKVAVLNYKVGLLTGDNLYSSELKGPKEFKIGQGGVESGLEEGILLLRVGDRVKFIIPSHLAFGLVGDGDKIPAKATLVYDVELIELK
jgi:FKBP-type peptidyl-prolyl cis-trans isomerase